MSSEALGRLLACGAHHGLLRLPAMAWRDWGLLALVLVEAGRGTLQLRREDGTTVDHPIGPGDLLVLWPDQVWRYAPEAQEPWSERFVTCSGPLFACWQRARRPLGPVVHLGRSAGWSRRFARLPDLAPDQALVAIQGLLADAAASERESGSDPWTASAFAALAALPGSTGRVWQGAARRVGLSSERFRKRFVAAVGCSPAAWLDRQRMAEARSRVAAGEALPAIAAALGFSDVHHFSRRFTKLIGLPPSQWRAWFRS